MNSKSKQLTTCRTVGEFFYNEVDTALRAQQLEASQEVEFYLVNLLQAFCDTDAVRVDIEEPFALLLERAVFTDDPNRAAAFRRLGDITLYVSGLFAPSLRRRAVDVKYAIRMGAGAYASVAALASCRAARFSSGLKPLFEEMAHKFAGLVEVLTQISERTSLAAGSFELADLYERWTRSHGAHLLERMNGLGAYPVIGATSEA